MSLLVSLRLLGIGGIGIVRMSGNECFQVLEKIFEPKQPQPIEEIKGYTIKYGHIMDKHQMVDEVLVSYFKSPKSYTTENMCEIQTHGGQMIVRRILELCLQNGAELAEPGEFTKKAFLNGRIDLLQAEAVMDIIQAKSEKELKVGMQSLEGKLSKKIQEIKQKVMDVMVNIEVDIDYPEYDLDTVTSQELQKMLATVSTELHVLENSFDNGKRLKEGIKTAIIGRPNAGKSSLLNAMLQEERAIVTEIEGTTRDTIEEYVTIEGIPLQLIDTAGIREAKDEVERIGIEKSKKMAEKADLLIAIFDSSQDLTQEDKKILELAQEKTAIIVLNKIDLVQKITENTLEIKQTKHPIVKISTLKEQGIQNLYQTIHQLFDFEKINVDNSLTITNIRHKNFIHKAYLSCEKAKEVIDQQMPLDIIAIFLREILENLGNITGEIVTDDILNEIFSKFCLGK